jgi:hypothetical protein
MTNIITAGGWYVGNTAILDWLDGFDEVTYVKGDLNICRKENGIMDVLSETNVEKKISTLNKIRNECIFCLKDLIRAFVGRYTKHLFKRVKPKSYSSSISYYRSLYKFSNEYIKCLKQKDGFDEYELCKNWLYSIAIKNNPKISSIIYQNPFFYEETFPGHEGIWQELFCPYKLIFVHRDPLDQFSDIVNSGDHLLSSWSRFHGNTDVLDPVERFYEISKRLYAARIRIAKESSKNDLLIFSFEDFIMEHHRTGNEIKKFIGINSTRAESNKRFILEESKSNIGKGKCNNKINKMLIGKEYVMNDLNLLRDELISIYDNMD